MWRKWTHALWVMEVHINMTIAENSLESLPKKKQNKERKNLPAVSLIYTCPSKGKQYIIVTPELFITALSTIIKIGIILNVYQWMNGLKCTINTLQSFI